MRSNRRYVPAVLLVVALVAAACGGDGGESPSDGSAGKAERGGILRLETEEFSFTGGFDPTGEYLGNAVGVMTNLLIRGLVSFPHVAGAPGNEAVADLAVELPEPTNGGKTYTFTIKDGVTFGPPVNREIVCADFEYAFRRIATADLVAQYANYYEGTIKGLKVGKDPGPGGIPGIECNGDKEITFHLTRPAGDFLYRLAMPAAAPVPEEVAGCFDEAGEYGRYLVSSAGYMFEGADEADASSCKTLEPFAGYNPSKQMIIVRRPDYDAEQATDDYRGNYIDEWHHVLNTNTNDLEQRVLTGANDIVDSPTPPTIRKFVQDTALAERLRVESGDRTWYITMNLNEAPFDDIHVRKAVNLVMDKEGLQRAWGGETSGEISTHIIPDTMLGGALDDYDPYPSEGFAGDVEAAMAEMKQSKYDTNGDGKCDESDACQDILMVSGNIPPYTDMLPVVEDSLSKIGITLDPREVTDAYTPLTTVSRRIPISTRPGWGKDYPDVYTFVGVLFTGANIQCVGNYNYSLVGLTAETAKECGIPLNNTEIPSVDEDVARCHEMTGDERASCWVELDQKLMEDVVPWVPYLDAHAFYATSPDITKWEFDQFSTTPAWSNIAVDPSTGA